jgi:hypothetical protein
MKKMRGQLKELDIRMVQLKKQAKPETQENPK